MRKSVGLLFAALAVFSSLAFTGTLVSAQEATPSADMATPASAADCEGLGQYVEILVDLGAGLAANTAGLDAGEVSEWTDEQYSKLVDFLTATVERLTGLTPPEIAQKTNEYLIAAINTVNGVLVVIRETGIGASLPFGDQLDKIDEGMNSLVTFLQEACPGLGTPAAA